MPSVISMIHLIQIYFKRLKSKTKYKFQWDKLIRTQPDSFLYIYLFFSRWFYYMIHLTKDDLGLNLIHVHLKFYTLNIELKKKEKKKRTWKRKTALTLVLPYKKKIDMCTYKNRIYNMYKFIIAYNMIHFIFIIQIHKLS